MLDVSLEARRSEIEAAKKLRTKRLARFDDMVSEYTTPSYAGGYGPYVQENSGFEVMAAVNPQLVFANPRVKLTSRRPEYQKLRTQGLESALNRWIKDTDPRGLYKRIAVDFQFAYGVILTKPARYELRTRREGDDYDDPLHRPTSERISPGEFVIDPVAKTFSSARWMGHPVTQDIDDLIEEAEQENEEAVDRGEEPPWDIEAVRNLEPDEGSEDLEGEGADQQARSYRKSATLYWTWVPEHELEESPGKEKGFNGSWFVTPKSGDKELRAPTPAFVPRWGPYSFFTAYEVPDEQHPLSLLTATDGVTQALNRQAEANLRGAERRKSVAFVTEEDQELQEKVEEAPDGSVIPANMQNVREGILPVELGGVTETGIAAEQIAKERRDRMIGTSSARQGRPDAHVTATADVIAAQGSSIRVSDLQNAFQFDGVRNHLRTVAWFIDMDSRYVAYLGDEAKERSGMGDPVYIGGLYPENEQRMQREFPDEEAEFSEEDKEYKADDFDLLEIEIQPYSMQRSDDPAMQARAMQGFQIIAAVAPQMIQNPHIEWGAILAEIGDSMNWPGFERLVNQKVLGAMQQMFLGQQLTGQEPKLEGRAQADVSALQTSRTPYSASTAGGVLS